MTAALRLLCALALGLVALAMMAGGAVLMASGGPVDAVIAGVLTLGVAVLVWRRSGWAGPAYAGLLLALAIFGVVDAGWDGWALLSRLAAPAAFGLVFLLPGLRVPRWRGWAAPGTAAVLLAGLAILLWPQSSADPVPYAGAPSVAATGEWTHWGGDPHGTRWSSLTQLNTRTVAQLHPAWTYRTGVPADGKLGNLEVTPLMIGNRLFVCNNMSMVDALDAETGRRVWRYDSHATMTAARTCRGVAYAQVPGSDCPQRILMATLDARLIALDARTGRPCAGFGTAGAVDMTHGMGKLGSGEYYTTSAPTIARDVVVLGGWVTDGQHTLSAPGVVRAYDVRTGAFRWAWDAEGTREREDGDYTRGTPNAWAPMSADDRLGMVYVPTGNSTPDYWGAHRTPAADRASSSVVALDAATGRVRWTFQTVHHDLWDYDVPAQPTLLDIGGVPALLQPTKQGELFLLDRRNGRPIAPVTERHVPQGAAPGDRLSPTQPFSSLPNMAGPPLSDARMWGLTPLDRLWCRVAFARSRYEGRFTPPGLEHTIEQPGFMGAMSWGGVSVDPARGIAYVNSTLLPTRHRLMPRAEADALGLKPVGSPGYRRLSGYWPQGGIPFAVEAGGFLSPLGVPCSAPPYGMMTAVDLKGGRVLWQRPLGTARDSGPFGVSTGLPLTMGVPNMGGSVATAGGLVFIAATQEQAIRALEAKSGRILWSARLPAGGQATPMTYRAASGRQFVVVAAGGKSLLKAKVGDYLVAYALPLRAGGAR